MSELRDVPLMDAGRAGALPIVEAFPHHAARLLTIAAERHGGIVLLTGDKVSKWWLERCRSPYLSELESINSRLAGSGLYMLNLSYEWACTTAACPDPRGDGARLLRTLDWKLAGLGACVVVVRHTGSAGDWLNVTWPGFVGALTVLAPGRFAAAINQPPMRMSRLGPIPAPFIFDWVVARYGVLGRRELPPAHLLRKVAEEASDYQEARRMLTEEPLCAPVFFTMAGTDPDQGCLIERLETDAFVHESPVTAANHWLGAPALNGRLRTGASRERHAMLKGAMGLARELEWVRSPILNDTTRLAVVANPATGDLLVQGFEGGAPATRPTAFVA